MQDRIRKQNIAKIVKALYKDRVNKQRGEVATEGPF